jgi:hypothetical protein
LRQWPAYIAWSSAFSAAAGASAAPASEGSGDGKDGVVSAAMAVAHSRANAAGLTGDPAAMATAVNEALVREFVCSSGVALVPVAASAAPAAKDTTKARASEPAPARVLLPLGAGATVGKLFGIERAMKGGIGSASITVGAVTVAALVAVNATGDVIDPASGQVIAGTRGNDGQPRSAVTAICNGELPARAIAGMATTIGVIATDAVLTKSQANKLATMAHDGLARTIHPVHTMADGDTLFALATGASGRPGEMTVLGVMAAEVTARAVLNAVRHATGLASPDLPSARDIRRA